MCLARKLMVFALVAFGASACGPHHGRATKGSGKPGRVKPASTPTKRPEDTLAEALESIRRANAHLIAMGFDGLNDTYTIRGRINGMTGYRQPERAEIKKTLAEVTSWAGQVVEAARCTGGRSGEYYQTVGETVKARAVRGIAEMDRQDDRQAHLYER